MLKRLDCFDVGLIAGLVIVVGLVGWAIYSAVVIAQRPQNGYLEPCRVQTGTYYVMVGKVLCPQPQYGVDRACKDAWYDAHPQYKSLRDDSWEDLR